MFFNSRNFLVGQAVLCRLFFWCVFPEMFFGYWLASLCIIGVVLRGRFSRYRKLIDLLTRENSGDFEWAFPHRRYLYLVSAVFIYRLIFHIKAVPEIRSNHVLILNDLRIWCKKCDHLILWRNAWLLSAGHLSLISLELGCEPAPHRAKLVSLPL